MHKIRLDLLIAELGLTESRSVAQRLVIAGQVLVDGQQVLKPSQMINPNSVVEIKERPRYVSRGGEKLEAALQSFNLLDLSGWVCADVGSSTGGFTDCLLSHNAERVYAIDVGYGLLHWKLRNNPKVIVMERTNARNIKSLPEIVQIITIDVSFISAKTIFNVIRGWIGKNEGTVITLIKPQFEAGKAEAAKGEGVIRDKNIHRKVLQEVLENAKRNGLATMGLILSPLIGPKGNVEFLAYLINGSNGMNILQLINGVLDKENH